MEFILDGDGMAKLTKDQQEFWDILRMPFEQGCHNCKYDEPWDREDPVAVAYCKQCTLYSNDKGTLKWEWDGKIN